MNLRTCVCLLLGLAAVAGAGLSAAALVVRAVLAPLPGEWAIPLRLGPWTVQAGVPSMVRLATAPWAAPLLHGRSIATDAGRVHVDWQPEQRRLTLRCAPCRLRLPALGGQALLLPSARLSATRQGESLWGEVAAGPLRGEWRGTLSRQGLQLQLAVADTPIADAYALFGGAIPELARVRLQGRFAFTAQLRLPQGELRVQPRFEGFEVQGLGSEQLLHALTVCGTPPRAGYLSDHSPLVRAVIAAEDQRFFEHLGYDAAELAAALAGNQREDAALRGASTLSQQVAKLLITGDERSPVRKLRELLWAVEMERTLGKARILRLYLAHAPWGEGLCGAEAAARHHFGVRAHELEPAQAVWLAAMLHNPVLEAQRWKASGQINLARAQRIALALRPMPRAERLALAAELARAPWATGVPAVLELAPPE
ncbi:transglycosylase domain-containing protein [Ramlibacter tataouinensis]|uniref:Monofunctional peptidoglycan glycosyltransferase, Glycosyltransferase Family 51-like protein n=1 Tax=Ramlibacter tataouinensis (strain ATCC BAA-407 / DSM 14655 / LMG 21543 / TTB310) TaxID=365046 RepID=F5Y2D9_RAMTT|nr:biosynthetic peptidoglycan transglycosylase [Ramlibacter tataouinensis]AEG91113.1 monofunctional peptidoglycan glycosyltransferase, Glycosyltransferase Family 51-like protein [Ramlibacter tataouinensis TTB310]